MKTRAEIKSRIVEVVKEVNSPVSELSSFKLLKDIPRKAQVTLKSSDHVDNVVYFRKRVKHIFEQDYEIEHIRTIFRQGWMYNTYIINLDENLEPKIIGPEYLRKALRNSLYHRVIYERSINPRIIYEEHHIIEAYNLDQDNEYFIYKGERFTSLQQIIDKYSNH